jgi:hypothetical protein
MDQLYPRTPYALPFSLAFFRCQSVRFFPGVSDISFFVSRRSRWYWLLQFSVIVSCLLFRCVESFP